MAVLAVMAVMADGERSGGRGADRDGRPDRPDRLSLATACARRQIQAMSRLVTARLALAGVLAAFPISLCAQGAIDPRMSVRAAELVRQGERGVATDMLGRYLAVAPDDGHAWLQLGRLYVLGTREWHYRHTGDPDGLLLLDFASTAFDQATRLAIDSGPVMRAQVDVERALIIFEMNGWNEARNAWRGGHPAPLPPELLELGRNLLISCPQGGVILVGGDIETLAVSHAALGSSERSDVIVLRPELYAADPVYRAQAAAALGVDPSLPVRAAIAAATARRPICIAPGADQAAVPSAPWHASRLVRVSRSDLPLEDALGFTAVIEAERGAASPWVPAIRSVYDAASSHNPMLCPVLQPVFSGEPPASCRP